MNRAVFLDRDGVINRAVIRGGRPYPPAGVEELELIPGVREGLAALKSLGFLLIVFTNQPDVARGSATREAVERIHEELRAGLPLDDVLVCMHDDRDACGCRKPKPGMLLAAAEKHAIELSASLVIGDRWRDIEAGRAAGCTTILIDYGYAEKRPDPDIRVTSLEQAVNWIRRREENATGTVEDEAIR